MTTPHRTLLQQALNALLTGYHQGTQDAIAALREALEAPEPEPVMEFRGRRLTPEGTHECWGVLLCKPEQDPPRGTNLYAVPTTHTRQWWHVLPGGRVTDKWESARVGDFNRGWNEYRKAAHSNLEALHAAPPAAPEPVALESVHLTRDTRGMCVVRVNGRVAIRDNGDIIDHMATLEWFAAPPAAPDHLRDTAEKVAPDGWMMVPREPTPEMRKAAADAWLDCDSKLILNKAAAAIRAAIAASPAQPAVPLTEGRITGIANELAFGGGHCNVYELARAIERAHGIGGGNHG